MPIHLLFFLSGAAGLVYQVAWVRQFSLVFGTTVQSASVVTATFMAGLGLGGWLAGAWADRNRDDLLRAWGLVEIGIGALGAVLAVALPRLTGVSAATSAYVVTPEGWHVLSVGSHLARIAVASVSMLPPALLMGATLTLLVRHRTTAAARAGWTVGGLYAANTAGAALGALATDVALVPAIGLFATQGLAVAVNLGIGVAALLASRWPVQRVESVLAEPEPLARLDAVRIGAALFCAGFAAMGMELVWFRFLAGALGPYRAVFSVLLAVLLTFSALGSAIGGFAVRDGGRPERWFAVTQSAFVFAAIGGLLLYDPYTLLERQHGVAAAYESGGPALRAWLVHSVNGRTILFLVALPALAMGAAFPLGNALGQDATERVGRRLGALYLATTAGNVAGALVAGFLLLPGPGIQASVLILAAVGLLAPLLVLLDWTSGAVLLPGALAAVLLAILPPDTLVWSTFPYGRARDEGVLELREGLEQILVVTGKPEGPARLWTSGHPMTSTSPHAQRYMRAMSHVPLLLQDDPERVLVICVGAGNTVHAASLHPVEGIEAVDLSRDVIEVNRWFAHSNQDVFLDDRTAVFVNDGRHHLLLGGEPYDLITLEPPPLAVAGVSSLYAREFYELAASRLSQTGFVAQWLPAYQVPEPAVRSLVRAFVDVFPDAVLLVGSGRELILLGGSGAPVLVPGDVERRLRERPEVAADLERIGLGDVRELATMFAAGPTTLARATRDATPVTDDRPVLESAQVSHLMTTRLPADLFAPSEIEVYCPDCPDLDAILDVAGRLYGTPGFLEYSSITSDLTSVLEPPDLEDETLAAIASSETLTRVLVAPDALALRAQELWDAGEPDAARRHLEAARKQAPDVPLLEQIDADWDPPPPR